MSDQPGSPGNRIRIRIFDLRQLFNSMFLYRWWPLARERRLLGRLAEAEITLTEDVPSVRPP